MSEKDMTSASDGNSKAAEQPAADLKDAASAKKRQFPVIALLALIIALAAAASSAWLWFQQQPDDSLSHLAGELDEITIRLADAEERAEQLGRRLDQSENRHSDLAEQLEQWRDLARDAAARADQAFDQSEQVGESMERIEAEIQAQMQELWQREGEHREVDRELQRRLLLMEAASLLSFGQERAELGADPGLARRAYQRAAALIQRADDPRLGNVRRLVSRELDALEAMDPPDWLAAQARVQRQAETVSQWPLKDTDPIEEVDDGPAEGVGWLQSTRNALGRLVRVTPRAGVAVTEDQIESVREMVRLRWLAAELAIGRRDTAELDHHLRAIERLIDNWFLTDDAQLRSARSLIDELSRLAVATAPDDLGQALAALRAHLEQS